MAKNLGDLIREADELVSVKTASVKPKAQEDDVFKLAEELVGKQPPELTENDFNMTEKIAHSVAMVETLINMPLLMKVAEFEKKAKESGYTPAQIAEYFEKNASLNFVSIAQALPWFNRG